MFTAIIMVVAAIGWGCLVYNVTTFILWSFTDSSEHDPD